MPKEAAKEVDKDLDKGIAVWGDGGKGDVAGLEGGMAGGVAGGMVGGGAIAVPEDADPRCRRRGTPSRRSRRRRWRRSRPNRGLKVIILADGSVADVQVMRARSRSPARRWRR